MVNLEPNAASLLSEQYTFSARGEVVDYENIEIIPPIVIEKGGKYSRLKTGGARLIKVRPLACSLPPRAAL